MSKVFNFCAGPAMLPTEVMAQAQAEMLDWNNTGCSVMEISHRSDEFQQVANEAESDLRELLCIPDDYAVLFMQGGGRGQFSAVPLNLASASQQAAYLVSGSWSKSAVAEASRYVSVQTFSTTNSNQTTIHMPDLGDVDDNAAYLHYCSNETVDGIEIFDTPQVRVPLVADMSSNILSRPLDVTRFSVIYAGAQKNIGPSGLAVVLVRKSLLEKARNETPAIMNYSLLAQNGSMYNTPPTFAWYLAGLVFKWIKREGGLETMAHRNKQKANMLYARIDQSEFYMNRIDRQFRSTMNVPFQLSDPSLDKVFLQEAKQAGLVGLEGHRSVGGMRASIYNAMPVAGVQSLTGFMQDFERRYG